MENVNCFTDTYIFEFSILRKMGLKQVCVDVFILGLFVKDAAFAELAFDI